VLHWLFVCSGASGLIYQVVWVRAFGTVFGNTIYSASIVIAVFMLGLGIGSYALGRWADTRHAARPGSLLRVFGTFELTIGGLALALSALLPYLADLSAWTSSYERGADGWYALTASSYVVRAALAIGLLTPITLLMGGTLTLLIRHVVHDDLRTGPWRIALLYASNTGGAAVGCLLTDFALVPGVGIQGAQLVAVAGNLVAGVGALLLATQVRLKPDTTTAGVQPRAQRVRRSVRLQPDHEQDGRSVRLQPDHERDGRSVRLQPDHERDGRSVRLQPDRERLQPTDEHSPDSTAVTWTALAIALSGFAAMGLEIVWFRHFSMLLGEYRAVFSLLLAIILCGIGVGSLAGGWLAPRVTSPSQRGPHGARLRPGVELWMAAQALFVVATLAGFTLVDARQLGDAAAATAAASASLAGWGRAFTELWFNARPILLVVGVPAIVMGVAFPLANAIIQREERRVGRRAGALYLSNTAGAVCGSVVAGFLLLPVFGMQASVTLLVATAAAAVVPLYLANRASPAKAGHDDRRKHDDRQQDRHARRPSSAGPMAAATGAIAAAAVGAWLLLPGNYLISKGLLFSVDKLYGLSEGLTDVIAVADGPNGGRVLVTNGHPMSSTELFSQRYMRAMAHIPLLAHEAPRRVLVLCYGVGNTAHAVALHQSVERIEVVDLSRHVLEHSRYFEEFNRGVLRDPRVAVYVNDGRHHLRMQPPGTYDLITLEPPPIVHAGVASLYSREFYESARTRLAPKGVISQWLPVFGVSEEVVLSMTRAFVDVFPNAVLLSGANMNLLLLGTNDVRTQIDPSRVADALARAPAAQADLQRLDLGTLREIVGTFVAPATVLADATRTSAPVTDDRPLQEYGKWSLVDFGEGGIPSSLIAVDQVAAWCPGCFRDGRLAPALEGLDAYLTLVDTAYRLPPDQVRAIPSGRIVAGSGYLGSIVPDTPELPKLVAALGQPGAQARTDDLPVTESAEARYSTATALLEAGRFREAIDEFRAVLELRPQAVEARNNLGVALASTGQLDEAIEQFQQALAVRPDFADAQRNLALAREKRNEAGR
jgi:spermidine synthase